MEQIDQDDFLDHWLEAEDEGQLREVLLRNERFINITIRPDNRTNYMIGKRVSELDLPSQSLVTIIRRKGDIKIPRGNTVLERGDQLSIIGQPEDIEKLKNLRKV